MQGVRRFLAWTIAAAALLALLPAAAMAKGPSHGDRAAADRALQKVKDIRRGIGVHTGREMTPALLDLAMRKGDLDSAGRKQAASLLARPTGSEGSPGHAYTTTEATPDCGTHFCIHYVTTTADAPPLTDANANSIPDYVDSMLSVFEDEVFTCENGIAALGCDGAPTGLGWPQAPSDGSAGGNSKFDVYIEDFGNPPGIFGYAAPESQVSPGSFNSYMVMDDDYTQAEYGYADPLLPLRVTAAHEYNHVLQFGIDAFEDSWMFESTATWAEDKVYPAIDDYLNYMPDWVGLLSQPITDFASDKNNTSVREDLKVYGSAVWNHFLSERYGDDTILAAWQAKTQDPGNNGSLAPASYSTALGAHGSDFAAEFDDFAAATAEWNQANTDFPDVYPDIPASQRPNMTVNASATSMTLDHTTFAFRNIAPPGTPTTLRLAATLPAGLDGAVALVGRTTGGTVVKSVQKTTTGGALSTTLAAGTYARITAILVNSDTSTNGFAGSDWNWTADNKSFTGVRVTSGPVPATGAANPIAITTATLNGTVNPNGEATTYWFEYGTDTSYGTETTHLSAGSGTTGVAESAAISGLTRGTTYHFRMVATNGTVTNNGADQTFTTRDPPIVTTEIANPIAATGATLNGTLDPRGKSTTYKFEYGTTTGYGSEVTGGPTTTSGAVALAVTGLAQGTTYHYRLVATNADGTTNGTDQMFTTKDPPVASTDPASGLSGTGATLNATVDTRGQATTFKFEYGTTTGYGTQSPGGAVSTPSVSEAITGLAPGTVYHYRVVAESAEGITNGNDQSFTTPGPPIVATPAASGVTLTGATLNGTVNPTGLATTYQFEYGTDTSYGQTTPATSAGSASAAAAVAAAIGSLSPGTTYHYRLSATNAGGTVSGQDMTFKTLDSPPPAPPASPTPPPSGGESPPPPSGAGAQTPTPPALGLTLAFVPAKLRALIAKGLGVKGNCGEACTVTIKLVISRKDATRLKLRTTVATVKGKGGATLRLRLPKKAKKAFARLRSIRVKLVAGAVAPDGRKATLRPKTLKLKR
jgi:hypothetical protein